MWTESGLDQARGRPVLRHGCTKDAVFKGVLYGNRYCAWGVIGIDANHVGWLIEAKILNSKYREKGGHIDDSNLLC